MPFTNKWNEFYFLKKGRMNKTNKLTENECVKVRKQSQMNAIDQDDN